MLGGISPIQLVIVLVIVVLIFGTKKLRGMGKDIGGAVKGFKDGMNEKPDDADETPEMLQKKEAEDAQFNEQKKKDKQPKDD